MRGSEEVGHYLEQQYFYGTLRRNMGPLSMTMQGQEAIFSLFIRLVYFLVFKSQRRGATGAATPAGARRRHPRASPPWSVVARARSPGKETLPCPARGG